VLILLNTNEDVLKFSKKKPLLSEKDCVSTRITSGILNFLKVNVTNILF